MATPSLLSVRLSAEERAVLLRAAKGRPLSTYVRERLFGDADETTFAGRSSADHKKYLAKCLHDLGASGIAKSLADLIEATDGDRLALDDDLCRRLSEALEDIREMRAALLKGLGLRTKEQL